MSLGSASCRPLISADRRPGALSPLLACLLACSIQRTKVVLRYHTVHDICETGLAAAATAWETYGDDLRVSTVLLHLFHVITRAP